MSAPPSPEFWNDSREAKRVLRAADGLREELEAWNGLISRADDLAELAELADGAADAELEAGVEAEYAAIEADYERMRTSLLFSRRLRRLRRLHQHQRRRRRHRGHRLGRDAAAHVPALVRAPRLRHRDRRPP